MATLVVASMGDQCAAQTAEVGTARMVAAVADLREAKWRDTILVNTTSGVVQYTGDIAVPGGFVAYFRERLQQSGVPSDAVIVLKTADVELYIPDVQASIVGVVSGSTSTSIGGSLVSAPISALLSSFSKNKSASAVFCVNVNGLDYLGNEAHLFRFGAESELKESVELATRLLLKNIAAKTPTDNVACERGAEGGQAHSAQ